MCWNRIFGGKLSRALTKNLFIFRASLFVLFSSTHVQDHFVIKALTWTVKHFSNYMLRYIPLKLLGIYFSKNLQINPISKLLLYLLVSKNPSLFFKKKLSYFCRNKERNSRCWPPKMEFAFFEVKINFYSTLFAIKLRVKFQLELRARLLRCNKSKSRWIKFVFSSFIPTN